jgi:phenylacetate-CoA ligase
MNVRKNIYFFFLQTFRGIELGHYYDKFCREDEKGIPTTTAEVLLERLFAHCQKNVPYYAKLINDLGDSYHDDPIAYLQRMPILTKKIIRENFNELQSMDLAKRKWFYMTSSGSTGEPIRVIQDYEFSAKAGAIQLLFSHLIGRETGECEVYLWGSEREIIKGSENWKAKFANKLTNSIFFNSYRMSPIKMREIVEIINIKNPKLIVAYADSIYGFAKYIEQEKIYIKPQKAIITSAENLSLTMRKKIEEVFQCKVFNRYGSREIGNIACERPGIDGLWVAPWGNYLEILDSQGLNVPDGTGGEIIVTSLINYAMPMIRYRIDDYGTLFAKKHNYQRYPVQIIKSISGRSDSLLRTVSGTLIDAGFLQGLFDQRNWVKQYQIIQKDYHHILYRIALLDQPPKQEEISEITTKTRLLFGDDCLVNYDFIESITSSGSGKYHWVICEIKD